ncbi:hypothetical protein ACFS7Z_15800 [Pontibacter toksunensis]|uniref:Outer membrane protein beta-barrel domain-containing protein n=1 Tax=Pontibacter toksunensis TaxID=1332631 RepID=A0ABW6BVL8_9BACT
MLTDKELEEIRRKMLELEEEPPVGVWAGIQAEVQPKKNWRPLWWLLSLLLLLLTGLGTYHVHTNNLQQEETVEVQAISSGATPLADAGKLNNIKTPSPATPQPVPLAAAQSPVAREQTASGSRITQAGRQVENKIDISEAENTVPEGGVLGLADTAEKSTIPHIVLLPDRAPENVTTANRPDRRSSSRPEKLVVPASIPAITTENIMPVETEKSKNAIETTTTSTLSAVEGTVSDNVNQEMSPQLVPAVTADKKDKNEKKPAVVEKRLPSKNEWAAGVYFAPRYAFRKFIPNANDEILIMSVRNVNQLDPKRMGYEFGANFSRVLAPNLFVEAGLCWMQLKENVAYTLTTGQIDTFSVKQSNNGQIVVESKLVTEERQLISSYAYGGLRLGITQYFLERGNSRFNLTVAGGANLLIKGETRQFSNGEWTETVVFPSKENILEQSNYNLQVGVGYNVSVLQKYEIMLMPTMSYFIGSTFKEREPLGLRPYSLGVNLQLKRRFNL